MKDTVITEIVAQMQNTLTSEQLMCLKSVLEHSLWNAQITFDENGFKPREQKPNEEFLQMFIDAKRLEGCSERTLCFYASCVKLMFKRIDSHVTHIKTEQLREFLSAHKASSKCSQVHIDNIRRNLSSFFTWLEEEGIILKSPIRRIKKVKTAKKVKEVYTDQMFEQILDACETLRDKALISFLAITGVRVSEAVNLDILDVELEDCECVVLGKGNKERTVYFDARTQLYLTKYLNSRTDDNPALFVSLLKPHDRLMVSGVEITCRKLGRELGIGRVHPHKFRRSVATRAIDKGMPIEQVQKMLGHEQIGTTLIYAQVSQENVKNSHKKYLT